MNNVDKFEEVISRAKVALKVQADAELAAIIGLSPTAFSNRKAKGTLPYEKLTDALTSRNVDLRWVFTGSVDSRFLRDATFAAMEVALRYSAVGQQLLQEMQEAAFAEHLTSEQLLDRFRDRLPQSFPVDNLMAQERAGSFAISEYQLVPRSSARPSAGHGMLIESEQIVDYMAFKREWLQRVLGISHQDIVLVEVRGDSMAGTLDDGDLVLIDMRQNRLDASAIFVIQVGDALLVKRVQRKLNGTILIKSDNLAYEAETLEGDQLANLKIMGRVVWPRLR
ncbi:MAG: LexA family transcriptional regulator [Oxalobacteraceae bacterium]|nr:LexA family transcriptional regulator [Oxalobacteraceae bacterium]